MSTNIDVLRRQLERERAARKEAEKITEQKTREIYYINQELRKINDHLEEMVADRTADLEKAHDEAIRASQIKSQFLANMSHELRTPLNAIIGYSEMLMEEAELSGDNATADDLGKIRKSGHHLLDLINDILDISKIEAGKMDVFSEECDLRMLCSHVVNTVMPLIETNGNTIDVVCENGQIITDETKLRQILMNLLSNAAKFTYQGQITFHVQEEIRNGHLGYAFRVSDTGIGMTPEQMEQLFQPFTQADSSTTRNYGGTGLGLAISLRFSEMLAGTLEMKSVWGEGSEFTCWLPQNLASETKGFSHQNTDLAADYGMDTILIIDDEPDNESFMRRLLAKEAWPLLFASNGPEGLRVVEKFSPKVICLDILMPNMDGWGVLAALKNDPKTKHIPVIILSFTNDKQLAFTRGASEFLTKPVQRERLIEVLHTYMHI
ncbi:ATP-binding protein [Paenibacillus sp. N3.4]|uniref:ATP-binding response regulator n=1 Tax=Paenibacillus sp. N3.4 TaxID=2603222 RepID=UPI0011CAC194|nr:ATP-binding protein [Paenibacillus sp. N3.4]TXK74135.1 response regulator [Paenibacillus sp. N3.4]